MAKKEVKWTQELRKIVYARLVMEFGPHATWQTKYYPKDQKERYWEVLEELARYLKMLTRESFAATAIDNQIAWAISTQKSIKNSGYSRQNVMNKAAALEMGFLETNELPSTLQPGR